MSETLVEIVARAIWADPKPLSVAALSAALRNPPAHVVEAGARAFCDMEYGDGKYDSEPVSDYEREEYKAAFLTVWRAAIGGKE